MSSPWRTLRRTAVTAIGLLAVVLGWALLHRAHLQRKTERALAIQTPNGVDEGMYVKIGGIDQWIQIRGQDRGNPVLLCLHGGPGATWLPLTALFLPWEKEFTLVQWDQRGAGRTLEATGAAVRDSLSIDRMAKDGLEVAQFLKAHLHKNKIILLGHSFGSILGIRMVRERPDLFSAYVGTGQVGNMQRSMQIGHAYCLEKARAAGDTPAVQELLRIGPPPYDSPDKVRAHFKWLGKYEVESDRLAQSSLIGRLIFRAPHFSFWDIYNRARGFGQIPTWRLYQEMLDADLPALGTDFKVPIDFFQGTEDEVTAAAVAKDYFDRIDAPRKDYVTFEGAGHFAVWTIPDKFLQELLSRVRPLATQP